MIFLDIKNLLYFCFRTRIVNNTDNRNLIIKEIIENIHSVNIIINKNFFEYKKKVCFKNDGFVMGKRSELYIQNDESIYILVYNTFKKYITAYFRYVSDIFDFNQTYK